MSWQWLLVVVAACGGKKSTRELDSFSDVIAAWLPAAATQAWQGAWVMTLARGDGDSGTRVAVSIAGDRATLFDGANEVAMTFSIDRPCEATFTGRGKPMRVNFAWADGKLVVGSGAAGMRRGDDAVVCGIGRDPGAPEEGVYAITGNACATWKPAAGAWSERKGVCAWDRVRGEDLVDVGTEHYSTTMVVAGELLQSRGFADSVARGDHKRAASYADAKAAVAEARGATDPLEQAKAAGGVVGDLATIAGLQATFAANRNDVAARPLELAGAFVETSTLTVQGQVWNVVVVADPVNTKAKKLLCQTQDDPSGLAPGAKVVVRGRIDFTHDHARLRPCSLVK